MTTVRTRSTAPFALVYVASDGSACLVGYAHSTSDAVRARARRLRARIIPIRDGRVDPADRLPIR